MRSTELIYSETYAPVGETIVLNDVDPADVTILDVTQVGNELRFRYVVRLPYSSVPKARRRA